MKEGGTNFHMANEGTSVERRRLGKESGPAHRVKNNHDNYPEGRESGGDQERRGEGRGDMCSDMMWYEIR